MQEYTWDPNLKITLLPRKGIYHGQLGRIVLPSVSNIRKDSFVRFIE